MGQVRVKPFSRILLPRHGTLTQIDTLGKVIARYVELGVGSNFFTNLNEMTLTLMKER